MVSVDHFKLVCMFILQMYLMSHTYSKSLLHALYFNCASQTHVNPLTAILINWNFHPLEVVSR